MCKYSYGGIVILLRDVMQKIKCKLQQKYEYINIFILKFGSFYLLLFSFIHMLRDHSYFWRAKIETKKTKTKKNSTITLFISSFLAGLMTWNKGQNVEVDSNAKKKEKNICSTVTFYRWKGETNRNFSCVCNKTQT